ncbi:HNH endonuclease signature motif containing protein [Nocardioides sp. URHA0020]|uniref:HNH endonuclease signature motif containing protein n=1 Tax=Nocardioides sp. URHA0020 TaxID=1380392 RepID=UPI00048EF703|nr:HNH endonuclease signature motif containing protein [Nocardioides sp. URHA0020]
MPAPLLDDVPALAASASTPADVVDLIAELEAQKSRACAAQARLAERLDELVRAEHRDLRLPVAEQGRGVASQVAFARRESPAGGRRLLGLAHALVAELPHALAAMEAGVLSEWRATLIARETACLSREDRARVDERICAPDGAGGRRFDGWGDRRLVAECQRLVARLDPEALVDRRARAEAERRVSVRPAPDTMSQLSALLPAAQGIAVWATLTRVADLLVGRGDGRSRGQIMADTLVQRITGQSTADAVPVRVNLVVSDETLLAGGHEPAWLQDFGPLTPDAARDLVLGARGDAIAELRRLYAAPDTGALVAMDSRARFFPAGLASFIELRDRTCRSPYCDAVIRQRDHVVPDVAGGDTSAVNGQGLCQQCNLAKQGVGWRSRPITGPPGALHTVETTLPTGHAYRSTAPAAPTPCAARVRSDLEWSLRRLILVA